ncbi:unnamed protein product [Sphagnum balticum]
MFARNIVDTIAALTGRDTGCTTRCVFRSVPKAAARKVTIFIRDIQHADADDQCRTYIENGVNVGVGRARVCGRARVGCTDVETVTTSAHCALCRVVGRCVSSAVDGGPCASVATGARLNARRRGAVRSGAHTRRSRLPARHSTQVRTDAPCAMCGHTCVHRCHNNLSPSSIFVGAHGEWQLGSFECARTLDDTRHWLTDAFVRRVASTAFMPPEDQQAINKVRSLHCVPQHT